MTLPFGLGSVMAAFLREGREPHGMQITVNDVRGRRMGYSMHSEERVCYDGRGTLSAYSMWTILRRMLFIVSRTCHLPDQLMPVFAGPFERRW